MKKISKLTVLLTLVAVPSLTASPVLAKNSFFSWPNNPLKSQDSSNQNQNSGNSQVAANQSQNANQNQNAQNPGAGQNAGPVDQTTQSDVVPDGKGGYVARQTTTVTNANGTTVNSSNTDFRNDSAGQHRTDIDVKSTVNKDGEPLQTQATVKSDTLKPDGSHATYTETKTLP